MNKLKDFLREKVAAHKDRKKEREDSIEEYGYFDPSDTYGCNIDDAYFGGCEDGFIDGEGELAKLILAMIADGEEESYKSESNLDPNEAPEGYVAVLESGFKCDPNYDPRGICAFCDMVDSKKCYGKCLAHSRLDGCDVVYKKKEQ